MERSVGRDRPRLILQADGRQSGVPIRAARTEAGREPRENEQPPSQPASCETPRFRDVSPEHLPWNHIPLASSPLGVTFPRGASLQASPPKRRQGEGPAATPRL